MSDTGPTQTPASASAAAAPAAPTPSQAVTVSLPLAACGLLTRTKFPFKPAEHASKGYHLEAVIPADQALPAAIELDAEGFALDTITGVDWLAEGQMEVVYDYFHPITGIRAVVRSRISRENPQIPSIAEIFAGANWHERETHDFFGITFLGHPDLTPFLLPEDATYHPLRKDFIS